MRLLICMFLLISGVAHAAETLPLVGRDTGLPLPRYASLKDAEVFVRAGPGQRYPIKFVYQRRNLPIKIVNEFGGWRKITDQRGGEGWVYNALVSGARTAMVQQNQVSVRRKDESDARSVAELSNGVITNVETCTTDFCKVKGEGYEGFVERKTLWGIDPKESFAK